MPHYFVTTRFTDPIEAKDADEAQFRAEEMDFGMVEVSEVVKKGGQWVRTGPLTTMLGPVGRMITLRVSDNAEVLNLLADFTHGDAAGPLDLEGHLDGNPVTIRLM